MYYSYIVKRTQIYLDADQRERLAHRAEAASVTSSKLIRDAVEAYLAPSEDESLELARQRQALHDAFGSIPRLPDGVRHVDESREIDQVRERELEDRWRSR